jgi:tRNA modification GTPase
MLSSDFFSSDTICALSTPDGVGALSVVRMSGRSAFSICDQVFIPAGKHKSITDKKLPAVIFGRVMDGEQILDEALVTAFKGPNSFSGEDTVEFSLHGSSFIRERLMQLLIEKGARPATQGEFTKRAFMNGKMDLSQAEAIGDLIHSESAAAHKIAMHQMRGGFGEELRALREGLVSFASLIELELDFGEEDVEFANREDLKQQVDKIRTVIHRLTDSFKIGNAIKNGVPVAIVGAPNVGKSTLLNALLNEEKAIVSSIAGTTRDVIEDTLTIDGILFRIIDTAGIRDNPDNEIERIGIERTFEKIKGADIVLYITDGSTGHVSSEDLSKGFENAKKIQAEFPASKVILVANKCDLRHDAIWWASNFPLVTISAKEKQGIDDLKNAMVAAMGGVPQQNQTVVTNLRHYDALVKADNYLQKVLEGLDLNITNDFVAMDIRQSLYHLGEITGQVTVDDLLENIFSKFCIGK